MDKDWGGVLEQVWFCGAVLPNSLVDLLDTTLVIVKRKKKRRRTRKTRKEEFSFTISVKAMMKDDLHLSYEAHGRLRRGS